MQTLSSRVVIAPLAAVLLLTPVPRADANEFPQQKPQAPQQIQRQVRPELIIRDRAPVVDVRDRGPVTDVQIPRTPNVVGQRVAEAKGILERAGFRVGQAVAEPTRGASPGTVIRQDPAPGTPNKQGAAISLWIATAPPDERRYDDVRTPKDPGTPPRGDGPVTPPRGDVGGVKPPAEVPQVTVVPDLGGRSVPEAFALLEKARLRPGPQRREESESAPNTVVGQAPPAGYRVPVGTPVGIVVATQILVEVPDLVGRPLPEAVAHLQRSRLGVGQQQREESEAVAGTVVNQSPSAGRRVPVGFQVALGIATPVLVTVPDLRGTSEAHAIAQLQSNRLRVGDRRPQESEDAAGSIVDQRPAPGARVSPGTPVSFLVAVPILVSVPDLRGTPEAQAIAQLQSHRLRVGDRRPQESEDAAGSIVDQRPAPGARVSPGTPVSLLVAVPALVYVPDITGRPADEASRILRERQLSLGDRRRQESNATPGSITRQSPGANVRVPRGTRIDVVVAIAPPPVVPPPQPPRGPDPTPPTLPPTPPVADPGPLPAPVPPSTLTPTPTPATPNAPTPSTTPPVVTKTPTPTTPPAPKIPSTPPPATAKTPTPPTAAPPSPAPASPTPAPAPSEPVPPVAAIKPVTPPATPPARQLDWLYPVALSVGLVVLFGGAGVALYRYSARWKSSQPSAQSQPSIAMPTLEFTHRWDAGTVQIGPAGALSASPGLRLVSGIESDPPYLDNEHIVKVAAVAGDRT